ncbi:MAG: hypothetical protein IJ038_06155 [Clostridia bacterium]|nr:hypothetical protein [Clostridia bacterium]
MFKLIFLAAFLLFALIAALIGMLKGRKYKWQISASRLAIVIVSAIIAMLLAAVVSYLIAMLVFSLIGALSSSNETVNALFEQVPTISAVIKAVIAMLLAPAFFIGFFFTAKGILNRFDGKFVHLVMNIVKKCGKKKSSAKSESAAEAASEDTASETSEASRETSVEAPKETSAEDSGEISDYVAEKPAKLTRKEKKLNRNKEFRSEKFDPIGAVCGAVCGFLVYIVILIPIVGGMNSINGVVQIAASASDDKTFAMVSEISDAAAQNGGAKTVKILGGDLIYSGLTTYPVNGRLASLNKEIKLVSSIGSTVVVAFNEDSDKKAAADGLREAGDLFEDSTMIPMLVSDFLSSSSGKWSKGEEFCGIAAPGASGSFGEIFTDVYAIMKDSTYENVAGDFKTIMYSLAAFVENDTMSEIKNGGALALFRDEETISAIMFELLENERTQPLVGSITNTGISLMTQNLNVSESDDVLYDGFIEDMTEEYNYNLSHGGGVAELSEAVAGVYDEYGIEISSGASACIAAAMMNELSACDTDDMERFFSSEASASQSMRIEKEAAPMTISSSNDKNSEALSVADRIMSRVDSDPTIEELQAIIKTEFAALCAKMSAEEFDAFSLELAGDILAEISDGGFEYGSAAVDDADDMGKSSVIVTSDELKVVYVEVEDKEKEAKTIASIFASAIAIVDDISGGDHKVENVITAFGPVLDSFAESQLMGKDYTGKFLTAMLQADAIRSNIGFTVIQATDVASSINGGSSKGESYTVLLKSLGNTVNIIKISSENGDATEAVNELMKDLTPTSAETLQKLSTPETVKNYGVADKSAAPVSDMLSDMFGNMSDAKENGMPEEEYEKESAAVNDMMNIAMSATKSDEKTTFGDNSATGITATEFVQRATDSVIISETLVNTVYGESGEAKNDPLNSERNLTEEEKTELVGALDAKWKTQLETSSDAEANAEYEKLMVSIASVLNVPISISGNSVTLA